jgi:hypothetical protein
VPIKLDANYTIFQKNIIQKLEDRRWFNECMAFNYSILAAKWGCAASMSARRLGEAYDFWREDHTRTLTEGIATSVDLDHFKHASFIAFWLRRMLPINETRVVSKYKSVPDDPTANDNQKFFLRYGSELCALLIGFEICLFYEFGTPKKGAIELRPNRLATLKLYHLPSTTIADFVMILKHKNMSPHALYLLYKSLFTTITART